VLFQVPFDELKRRLYRRMAYMGLSLEGATVLEEEASWIPLGGPTPIIPQPNVAFGAAAVMVHPASGYSIVNSLRRAAPVAAAIAKGLQDAVRPTALE
jgi:lycopene epsilon-cyclase